MDKSNARFENLYKENYESVFRYCYYICGDRDMTMEVVQDGFAKAYINFNQLRDPASFRPWVFKIVKREALRALSNQRKTIPIDCLSNEEVLDIAEGNGMDIPVESLNRNEMAQMVRETIQKLSPVHREIIIHIYLYDMTYKETAKKLGVTMGTVKSRLHRAKQEIAKYIKETWLVEGKSEAKGINDLFSIL